MWGEMCWSKTMMRLTNLRDMALKRLLRARKNRLSPITLSPPLTCPHRVSSMITASTTYLIVRGVNSASKALAVKTHMPVVKLNIMFP